ncbi:UNVERIFIED_CONTAM: ABC-type polar amino acid transport system ATPase subunit [Streptomyces canus]
MATNHSIEPARWRDAFGGLSGDVMRLLATSGMTMIAVTHEIGFAREVADRVIFMDEGRIAESGPARRTLEHPETARLREFLARVL